MNGFVAVNKLTWVHGNELDSRPVVDFPSSSAKILFCLERSSIVCLGASGLGQDLHPSLFLMTLSVLSKVRQAFYRMSFSLNLSPVFLMIRLGLWDLGDAQAFPDIFLLIMFQQMCHACVLDPSDSLRPRELMPARLLCPWDF